MNHNMEKETETIFDDSEKLKRHVKRRTFISFSVFIVANIAAWIFGWRWLKNHKEEDGIPSPLRSVFKTNEKVNKLFFSDNHLAKEYPVNMAVKADEVNMTGEYGLAKNTDMPAWKLAIARHPVEEANPSLQLTMNDVRSFPKKDLVFDFKCVEGWSQISHWSGTSFAELIKHYNLGTRSGKTPDPEHPEDLYKYVALKTPDGEYYVGLDIKSAMHPQTILAYEMSEKELTAEHGYPLRLIIPVKYGIKNLKCIGSITFTDKQPSDYWHERGYDYDAAL